MCTSISKAVVDDNLDFSMWDSISYSDSSLPFGDIVSADQVRELFANNDALFGSGENDVWNTGLTLWSFIGQVLGDGKQRSCNAAVTHATKLFTNIHFLDKKLTLHGDMRVLWGFEGAKDGLDALEDAGGVMTGINAARHQDVYEREITANVSLTYRINSSAELMFFVQNIPVEGDNKRYSYSSGHNATNANKTSWIEEPTVVGFQYHLRF